MKRYNNYFLLFIPVLAVISFTSCQVYSTNSVTNNFIERKYQKANTTLIVYMAADNDLRSFAARNIKQMAEIGSNENLHIVVHLDIRIAGNKKITRRYYIESKDKILHMNADDPHTQMMDSGQPSTLISACKWAIKNFPADEYALIFWNHGTGYLDPARGKILNPTEFFVYNPESNMLELDRSTSILGNIHNINNRYDSSDLFMFLDKQTDANWQEIEKEILESDDPKGICWDDSTGNYLTNQKLDEALTIIRKKYLNNKKFSIIGFDACLMSMLEIGSLIKKHANIMVGSQEVELGTGWNYQKVLQPFATRALDKKEFARHIVTAYEETYKKITNDYTQSAISLDDIAILENNLNDLALLLVQALEIQQDKTVLNALRASKNKLLCTHFDEPSYIDLHHLYLNLEQNLKLFSFSDQASGKKIVTNIRQTLAQGRSAIKKIVFANVCGKNLSQAKGISIYFPERIHSSYSTSPFALNNNWFQLLKRYTAG
jgi:hypothetical protein